MSDRLGRGADRYLTRPTKNVETPVCKSDRRAGTALFGHEGVEFGLADDASHKK